MLQMGMGWPLVQVAVMKKGVAHRSERMQPEVGDA